MSENNVNNALLIAPFVTFINCQIMPICLYLKLHKAITTYEGPNHW